jgi:hypothetical protein
MYDFSRNIAHLFCCVPLRRKVEEANTPSHLAGIQLPPSTLSVPLPYHTVPHGSSESQSGDAQALHHIFSSSSSIRGYHTAATTPGYHPTSRPSLDYDFKFGEPSPAVKVPGRVEQFAHHIKQKVSERRLSRASSKLSKSLSGAEAGTSNTGQITQNEELGISLSTAGLSGLLASNNGSRKGYDSDAKSLSSPVLREDAGTLTVDSYFVKHTMKKLGSPSVCATPLAATPSGTADGLPSTPSHTKTLSSPLPATTTKMSFVEALQLGKDESPKDVLRRLSAGIADGTIRVPSTPELTAARLPTIKEINSD